MDRGLRYPSLPVVTGNRQPQGIFCQHLSIFITEEIVLPLPFPYLHIIAEPAYQRRAEGNHQDMPVFCVAECDLPAVQVYIPVLDITDRSGTASTVEKELHDDPVTILTETTVCFWLFQKFSQFIIAVRLFDCVLWFKGGDGNRGIPFLAAPCQEGFERPYITADGVAGQAALPHGGNHLIQQRFI